jgi:hypothetical protein
MENGYRIKYVFGTKGIEEHRSVMEQHIGRKLRSNEIVHHINGDRVDNRIENLSVMTRSEHMSHHRRTAKQKYGPDSNAAKLSWADVAEIKILRLGGNKVNEIAKRFGVDFSTVYRLLKNTHCVQDREKIGGTI